MKKLICSLLSFLLMISPAFLPGAGYPQDAPLTFAQSPTSQLIESLEFREVDIKDVLRHLARQYNLNIIFSEQVKGLVTVQLNNVTVEEALDSIITVNGFAYTRKERVIKVTTPEEAMREGTVTKVVALNNASAVNLKETLRKVLSANGSIEADIRSNSLIITDNPMVINTINNMIPQLDQMTPQVLIEAKIIETSLNKSEKLGIDWSPKITASGSKIPTTWPFDRWTGTGSKSYTPVSSNEAVYTQPEVDPTTGVVTTPGFWTVTSDFPYQGNQDTSFFFPNVSNLLGAFPMADAAQYTFGILDFSSFKAVLDLIKTRSSTKLVANPRITTLNNQSATINVGQVLSIPNYTLDEQTGHREITSWTSQNVGVNLQVTPQVSPDGHIRLKIRPEVSSLVGYAGTRDGVQEGPITSTRTAETEVQIRDGQTVVIAGLVKDKTFRKTSKVPFFGDIPFIGKALFTRSERSLDADPDEKTDLLIFVTARIIKDTEKPLVGYEHNVMTAPPRPLKTEMKMDALDNRFKLHQPKSKP